MIDPAKIDRVKYLLSKARLSHRAIAARVGVSHSTVNDIASGARTPKSSRATDGVNGHAGVTSRCPKCGALVYMPCTVCGMEKNGCTTLVE